MHEVLARAICQIRTRYPRLSYVARLFRTEDHTSPVLSANSIYMASSSRARSGSFRRKKLISSIELSLQKALTT